MPKVDYNKLIEILDENRIREVYLNNSKHKTAEILGIGLSKLEVIIKLLGLTHDSTELRKNTIKSDPDFYAKRAEKSKATCLERYNDEKYNNAKQGVITRESKYGSREAYNSHYTNVYI